MGKTVCVYIDVEILGISIDIVCLWISVSICQSVRPHCQTHTHTHTHSLWLSCQQFVFACACVSLYGPHFECFSDTCRLFDSKLLCPVPLCVCVCVCVYPTETPFVRTRERDTHRDRFWQRGRHIHTHTHILSLTHSLSLSLSISPSLSSRSCSIFLDLSSVTEKWKELCRMPDHCDVITPPIDILQERETHRIFQKRHTHPWFWMVVCRSPAI